MTTRKKNKEMIVSFSLGFKVKNMFFLLLLPTVKSKTVGSTKEVFVEDIIRKCEVFQNELL